jgi:hypothetical protein
MADRGKRGTWPRDHLDLCGPAFLRIDADGTGEMEFGALTASVDGGFTPSGIDFEWNGADEGDQVTGTGWATYATMATSKVKSPTIMATIPPSSPSRGLFQQPARAVWRKAGPSCSRPIVANPSEGVRL